MYDRVIVPALCLARRDHADRDLADPELGFVTRATREIGEEVALAKPAVPPGTDERVRVLIAPARDEIDQVAAELFGRVLDRNRWEPEVVTDELLAAELLERIERTDPAAVVIVSLPPGGVAHTRYLVTRIRGRFPDLKLVVGRWGRNGEAGGDTSAGGADWTDATMADTRKRLTGWYPVFAATAPAATNGKAEPVGTPAAVVG